jgi:hypothetical protein
MAAIAEAGVGAPQPRQAWVDAALLAVLPALFLYSGLFQLYPLTGWVDPGIYLGYFFDLPSLVTRYGLGETTYHGARLSWVLPGFWLHEAFSPQVAQLVLVGLMYFTSIWSAFLAGRGVGGRLGGHLAAAFFAYNPLFLAAVVFGAIDGICITYMLVATAALFSGLPAPLSRVRAAVFGVFACLATVAHPFAAPLSAFLALAYLLTARPQLKDILLHVAFATLGAIAAFLVLALIGMQFGMPFWFPAASAPMAQRALGGFGASYKLPFSDWAVGSYRLLMPAALIAALVTVLLDRTQRHRRAVLASIVLLVVSGALFFIVDLIVQGTTLQVRNYTNLTLPACAVALAALVGRPHDEISTGRLALLQLAAMVPALLLAALYAVSPDWFVGGSKLPVLFAALCIAGLVLAWRSARKAAGAVVFGLFVLACGALNQDSASVYLARSKVDLREAFMGAHRLAEYIEASPRLRSGGLLIWYDRKSFTTGSELADRQLSYNMAFRNERFRFTYYDTLSSLYLFDRSLLGAKFPAIEPHQLDPVRLQATPVIVLTQGPLDLAGANKSLAILNLAAVPVTSFKYESPTFGYTGYVLRVVPKGSPLVLPAAAQQ